ncbi:LamG-like jellyroll fold domain-containing protein [Actinokineospora sp. HUAS TT18]|uniref:LamG-like jellyroll fold domain-containing protein n=1 Tax=Actinokineospora sp. HUAS TT18 TaxID=3447451 RepID=UPI003F51D03E
MATTLVVPVLPAVAEAPDAVKTEAQASAVAKAADKSVRVLDLTDENTEVRALPDGTFSWRQHVRPVRVRRADTWVDVDTTLERTAEGKVRPRATTVSLEFSGGGRSPLVRMGAKGVEAGLDWLGDLPEPVLDGPTATYPEVLPGVDLTVTADVLGYQQLLVVKTPEAARNPKLKRITFGNHTRGLAKSADAITGDARAMWDSSGFAIPGVTGPNEGARKAKLSAEVTSSAITVTPDLAFLADATTKYPIFIDPSYTCGSCSKAHHVVVQSAWPNNTNFDRTDGALGDLKAGYVCEGSCFISRTYLRMNTGSLGGKHIVDAHLHVETIHSYYCSGATPTQLYLANWVDGDTTWNNQPGPSGGLLSTGNATKNVNHCGGNPGGMDLWAKSAIESASANWWGETTFLLRGEQEGNNTSWRRFDLNPYLVVHYNSYPNKPSELGMQGWGPNVGDDLACGAFLGTRTPKLRAVLSDPDGGSVNAVFHVPAVGSNTGTGNIPSGSWGEITVPSGHITADGTYNWHVTIGDGDLLGPQSDTCSFIVDTVVPGQPVITSPQYPAAVSSGGVGVGGKFTLSAPSGTSDIDHYLYSFTSGGDDPRTVAKPTALNGAAVVSWTPMASGPQVMSVRSVDRAGNRSAIARYQIDVADYQVGISGKVAQFDFDNTLADTARAKDLTFYGPPPPGGYFEAGYGASGSAPRMNTVPVAPEVEKEYYHARDSLIRTDSAYTVSAWVNPSALDQDMAVLSQDGTRGSGFTLGYDDAADRWAFGVTSGDVDNATTSARVLSAAAPAVDAWTHLTGVHDRVAGTLRLYVDGVLAGSVLTAPTWNAGGVFVIGAAKANGQRVRNFSGSVDVVRVHNRALAAADVTALHAGTAAGAPVAEYLFDNADLTDNLRNSAGNPDLALAAGTPAYATGYAGRALSVNDSTSSRPKTTGPIVSTTGGYSVSAWVKMADKTKYYTAFSQDGDRMAAFHVRYSPDVDRWTFGVSDVDTDAGKFQWAIGTSVPQANVWTHLTVVHDAGADTISLYVNGVLEKTSAVTGRIISTGPFNVGLHKQFGYLTARWSGLIDDVRVYDGALTAVEVAGVFNTPVERARYALDETSGATAANTVDPATAGSAYGGTMTWTDTNGHRAATFPGVSAHTGVVTGAGPAAFWSMENSLADVSGNGRDLTHSNSVGTTAPTYVVGRRGKGVQLDGTSQRLQHNAPVLTTSGGYSVSAWVKLDRNNGWFTIVSQDGTRVSPFVLQYDDLADRWAFSTTDGDRDNPNVTRAHSLAAAKLNTWTHLLGVHDPAAGKIRLYVNGYLEAETAFTAPWNSTGSFAVGRLKWNGNQADFFPGIVDEVRAFPYALNATDAHGLWNMLNDISAPRDATFRPDRSFTVAAWVRHSGYDQSARQAVSFGTTGRYAPFLLGYRPEWKRWGVLVETTGGQVASGKWLLSDNEASTYHDPSGWVHLLATYDSAQKRIRFYVNGIEQHTVPVDATTFTKVTNLAAAPANYAGKDVTLPAVARDLLIGRTTWDGVAADPWMGSLRDVRVFTGVLPDACDTSRWCTGQLFEQ